VSSDADQVAVLLQKLSAAGWDGDDLLFKAEELLPDLTFRQFCAGLAFYRARTCTAGYAFVHPAGRA
jgi:hypothetical protein